MFKFIFNEYLQLFKTVGLLGFLLLAYGVFRFFKLQAVNDLPLLTAAKCTVAAILCSGFTSYPLHVNIMLLLLATCLAIGFALCTHKATKPVKRQWVRLHEALITICFFLVCCVLYKGYPAYTASRKWATLRYAGSQNLLSQYKRIYPALSNNGKFLFEYGTASLADTAQKLTTISLLEKARQILIGRQGIEALTTAYKNTGNYDAAVTSQQFFT